MPTSDPPDTRVRALPLIGRAQIGPDRVRLACAVDVAVEVHAL